MAPRNVDEEPEEEQASAEDYDDFCKSLTSFAEQRGYVHVAPPHLYSFKLAF